MSKVSKLFADAGVDNAELITGVEQLLTTAESQKSDGIPKGRFNEVIAERNNLKADVAELEAKITGLETKLNDSKEKIKAAKAVQDELDEFKNKAFNENKGNWLEKSKVFYVGEDDKNFAKIEKIKGDFIFKDKPEEYTEQDIAHNLSMLKPYEKIGYFGGTYTPPDIEDDRSQGGSETTTDDPLDAFDG